MTPKEVEACSASTALIASLGWYDFFIRGGSLNLWIGIGGSLALLSVVFIAIVDWRRDRRQGKHPEDEGS